jgi:transcriptional regulator with XRE-family HTH domain
MAGKEPSAFGAFLRRHRLRAGLTQEGLAARAGLSPRGLLHLERGTRHPQPDTLRRLAAALNLTPAERAELADAAQTGDSPGIVPTALVGRERELAFLRERFAAARAGRGSLVLVGGEAGIGKTTLAEAALREARGAGCAVLAGRCFDLAETPPYGPFIDLFARYAPAPGDPGLPEAFARRGTVGAAPSQLALFIQIQDFLAAIAARRPVVILLDDLQWADHASLDLLRFLARSAAPLPLLFLVTYRTDELARSQPLHAALPDLAREPVAAYLDLGPLDDAAVRALVDTRFRLAAGDAARLVAYLQRQAEGNALFIGELLRAVQEAGLLARDGDDWALGDLTGLPVPALLRHLIDARAVRLGMATQRLLATAAVVGQEIPLPLLVAVSGAGEDATLDALEAAGAAHLVAPTPDGQAVRFAHALIREALYAGLSPPRRAQLHRRVADALLALPAPDPDALVHHLRHAHDPRLGRWLFEAGTRAFLASAQAMADDRYGEALPLLVGPDDARRRYLALFRLHLLRLHRSASLAYIEEAVRVGEALGDAVLAAFALERLGFARAFHGDIPAGLAEQERAMATLAAHPDALFHGYHAPVNAADQGRGTLASSLVSVGRVREALALVHAGPLTLNGHLALIGCAGLSGRPAALRTAVRDFLGTLPATEYRLAGYGLSMELNEAVVPYYSDDPTLVRATADAAEAAFARVGEAALGFPPRLPQLAPLILHGHWDEALAFLPLARRLSRSLQSWGFPLYGALVRARGEPALAWDLVRAMFPAGPGTPPGALPIRCALALQRTAAALALDAGDLDRARACGLPSCGRRSGSGTPTRPGCPGTRLGAAPAARAPRRPSAPRRVGHRGRGA